MQIKRYQTAQTVVEYALLISIVTAIMIAMSTMVRRSTQGMVKAVADQVGFQQDAEQDRSGGYMVNLVTQLQSDKRRRIRDRIGNVTYSYEDSDASQTYVLMNYGEQ